jgi:tRNA dimethylallyltransferase
MPRPRALLTSISLSALPVVAGGTGFYLRALLDGLFPAPSRSDEMRARLAARERRAARIDPPAIAALRSGGGTSDSSTRHSEIDPRVRGLLAHTAPITAWFDDGRDALAGFVR